MNFVGVSAMTYVGAPSVLLKSHVLQAEHLAEHVGASIAEHLAEHVGASIAEHLAKHESADIAEHELCMAQIHAEHHIHTYKLRQGVRQCLGAVLTLSWKSQISLLQAVFKN